MKMVPLSILLELESGIDVSKACETFCTLMNSPSLVGTPIGRAMLSEFRFATQGNFGASPRLSSHKRNWAQNIP